MSEEQRRSNSTIALSTKLEEDFVSPLTAMRGALEILRDFPDLARNERTQFVETALRGCARLEAGVQQLATSVYAEDPKPSQEQQSDPRNAGLDDFIHRVQFFDDLDTIDIDFTNLRFTDSEAVNKIYDLIDTLVEGTRREWYFMVNYRDCAVWPEAWVAFAHRGKKVDTAYSLGTVRYAGPDAGGGPQVTTAQLGASDPDFLESREAAVVKIEEMNRARASSDRIE